MGARARPNLDGVGRIPTRTRLLAAVLTAVLGVQSACSTATDTSGDLPGATVAPPTLAGNDGPNATGSGTEQVEVDFASIDPASMASLLQLIPATGPNRALLTLTDWDRARALSETQLVDDAGDAGASDYLLALINEDRSAGGDPRPRALTAGLSAFGLRRWGISSWRDEVGWTPLDLSASASVGDATGRLDLFRVRTPAGQIDDALQADTRWSDDLVEASYADHDYVRWSDDAGADERADDRERLSGPRPDGNGGQMAIVDGVVIRTLDEPVMQVVLETVGSETSLGADPAINAVTEALDRNGAYSGAVTGVAIRPTAEALLRGTGRDADEIAADFDAWLAEQVLLDPYTAVAAGAGLDADGHVAIIAMSHEEPAFALRNAELLTEIIRDGRSLADQPWSAELRIRQAIVETDRTTLVVVAETEDPRVAIEAIAAEDTLFLTR